MTTPDWGAPMTLPAVGDIGEVKDPVLRPLVYCEYRVSGTDWCPVFSSGLVEEMHFCNRHRNLMKAALDKEGE